MIRRIRTLPFSILLVLNLSCSSKLQPLKYFQSEKGYRSLAGIENLLSDEDYKLNSCFNAAKKSCFSRYPFYEMREGFEEDKQNRQTKQSFHGCILDESITCSYQNSNLKYVDRLNNLKKEFYIKKNDNYLDWTTLREFDSKSVMDIVFDLTKISGIFGTKEVQGNYQGISIDNRDLVSIPFGFHGLAIDQSDKIDLYCRSQLVQDAQLATQKRNYYKGSSCSNSINLNGQKLLMIQENGSEVIFGIQFGQFASLINKASDAGILKLDKASNELRSLTKNRNSIQLSVELMIANQILESNIDLIAMFLSIKELSTLPRKKQYKDAPHLTVLMDIVSKSLSDCIVYTSPFNTKEMRVLRSGLYIVRFESFGSVNKGLEKIFTQNDHIEILNPFLMSMEKLEIVKSMAKKSENFDRFVRKKCSSKIAVELDSRFILNEII